ncbi:HAMP domain-containing histidine kinase [Clostridium sp. WLY-B-L2]|uniref:histidine kinase n=1 Tax=Clostridium aromativorans TaxID=2836848 RepID=A0ABS8N6D3_9CLOT|nr:HAMP domain-containing sensor histidine kinase [Clostridium aromativorans]MCC9294273.1 HAMP domain-containing histidine kinase [Clostridium aromativorans]
MKSFSEQDKGRYSKVQKSSVLDVFCDATLEKQVQQLKNDVERNTELLNESQELNKKITEFISNISHELKTPLNVIFSAIQVLALCKDYTDKNYINKQSKYLEIMKQNCYRLMRLINNLLDISKLDSGFIKLNLHNRNIVSVVEDITSSLAPYVEDKGINLTFDTNVEEKIMAVDPDKMERIILNLLSNAVKFTPENGEIYVDVLDKGDNVYIKVKDTGVGIPEDKLQVIFERFGQVGRDYVDNSKGSGIGLYLVKSFVELHGGEISVKSTLNVGSEFTIRLPAKVIEEECCEESDYGNRKEQIGMEFPDIYYKT